MERTTHKKYITPEQAEAVTIEYFTDHEAELLPSRAGSSLVDLAFPDTPAVRQAAEQYRRGVQVDAYRFAMMLRKLRGRLIDAKRVLKQDRARHDNYSTRPV